MININGRFLFSDHPTGTHRSSEQFTRALLSTHLKDRCRIWCSPRWTRAAKFITATGCNVGGIHANSPLGIHLWEQIVFPQVCRAAVGVSMIATGPVFHRPMPHLMFVHDLNSLLIPEAFSWRYRAWSKFAKYEAIRRADRLVCFTEYVKKTILARLEIAEDRIDVIPQGPGISEGYLTPHIEIPKRDRTYFLCVGSLQPHKNLELVFKAWEAAKFWEKGVDLVIVGKPQAVFRNASFCCHAKLPGVRFSGYLCDKDLGKLYQEAIALIYPSFHEGFGLPLVEAYKAGTPGIAANVSCLPEVAGRGSILIDPHNAWELVEAMNTFISKEAVWNTYCRAAKVESARFSWKIAGTQLAQAIEKIS